MQVEQAIFNPSCFLCHFLFLFVVQSTGYRMLIPIHWMNQINQIEHKSSKQKKNQLCFHQFFFFFFCFSASAWFCSKLSCHRCVSLPRARRCGATAPRRTSRPFSSRSSRAFAWWNGCFKINGFFFYGIQWIFDGCLMDVYGFVYGLFMDVSTWYQGFCCKKVYRLVEICNMFCKRSSFSVLVVRSLAIIEKKESIVISQKGWKLYQGRIPYQNIICSWYVVKRCIVDTCHILFWI